ncbi:hypothetical protein J5N97_018649 [Dioscorea zingiberensis]|uniref:Uncharacterized protein n=1 Tax=Dioscorea zingiberensis TaxID=325984 RepID=A0A9D5CEC6_9LILI|nr:hypothetical protein J5N97_018649 [Dioscorea zingiberensis]
MPRRSAHQHSRRLLPPAAPISLDGEASRHTVFAVLERVQCPRGVRRTGCCSDPRSIVMIGRGTTHLLYGTKVLLRI